MKFFEAYQQTISSSCHHQGIGLHTGQICKIEVKPAPIDHGIIFKRLDLLNQPLIKAHYSNVIETFLCTKLKGENEATVGVVEHLMAALASCGIHNVLVEIKGPEIPSLDGSSKPFIDMINSVGTQSQNHPRSCFRLLKDIRIEHQDQWIHLRPANQFSLDVTCDLKNRQGYGSFQYYFDAVTDNFYTNISSARSYGFYEDAQMVHARGLSLGASLDNVVVINQGKIMNPEGLRFPDEFVRHKILDAVGDLYLAGLPLKAAYQAYNPSHYLNNKLLKTFFENPESWLEEKI